MDTLLQDLRFGARMLIKNYGFTLIALLTLSLGIGANTAIFSLINGVLLKPLPYRQADQLMLLAESSPQRNLNSNPVSPANFLDWQTNSKSFSGMSAYNFIAFTYTTDQGAVRINGAAATSNLFEVMGVQPLLGRGFTSAEEQPGKDDVVVISETLWERQFGRDANIIGQRLRFSSQNYTVIGVLPKSFKFPASISELWTPLALTAEARQNRTNYSLGVIGRLKDNVTLEAAQIEMQTIAKQLEASYPATNANWTVRIGPLANQITGDGLRTAFLTLFAAVVGVLLIACINVASLLSARLTARQREISLRIALGATRSRIVRQLLTESMLLSLLGGLLGIGIAYFGLDLLLTVIPPGIPRIEQVTIDNNVLLFTILVSLATGLFFSFAPAWQTTSTNINAILKDGSRGASPSRSRRRFHSSLVVSEVVLSLVLLVCAGLLMRSFIALRATDPGFKADNVLVNTLLVLPLNKYKENIQRITFFEQLIERIEKLPNVESAGGITALPLQGNSQYSLFRISGRPTGPGQELSAVSNIVTPKYFQTMSIPLQQGRSFNERDNEQAKRVAIINETLAKRDFPAQNPLGQYLYLGDDKNSYEIVGVVGDSRQFGLGQPPAAEIFTNHRQNNLGFMYVVVRTAGDPLKLATPIRREVAKLDPDQPVGHRTLAQQFDNAIAGSRFLSLLLSLFAGAALLQAMIGLYGVISYSVTQRTQEIGVRMALGAQRRDLLKMIVGQGLRLALIGIVLGAIGAAMASQLLSSNLYGVTAYDPVTYLVVIGSLFFIALLASYLPARRATKVDPIVALRYE